MKEMEVYLHFEFCLCFLLVEQKFHLKLHRGVFQDIFLSILVMLEVLLEQVVIHLSKLNLKNQQFPISNRNLQDYYCKNFVLVEFVVQVKDMNIVISTYQVQKQVRCCNFFLFDCKHLEQVFGFLSKFEYFVVQQSKNKKLMKLKK